MKIPATDWVMAQGMVTGWGEDGVRGKVGYDADMGQWYADLNDEDYARYQENLKLRHNDLLCIVKSLNDGWDPKAINLQSASPDPPNVLQERLTLYLVDVDCHTTRGYKITDSIKEIVNRKASMMAIGSTCSSCGKRMMAVLIWENL